MPARTSSLETVAERAERDTSMDTPFIPFADTEALDGLFARSEQAPVLVFQHDPGCPISRGAHRELATLDGEVNLLDVRRDRAVKREIESRTGIRHESPQAIVLRHGKPVWSASHHAITEDEVATALRENA